MQATLTQQVKPHPATLDGGSTLHGQPPSFFIAKAKTSATELAFEDAVLIDEVVDDVVLIAVDPTSDGDDE